MEQNTFTVALSQVRSLNKTLVSFKKQQLQNIHYWMIILWNNDMKKVQNAILSVNYDLPPLSLLFSFGCEKPDNHAFLESRNLTDKVHTSTTRCVPKLQIA